MSYVTVKYKIRKIIIFNINLCGGMVKNINERRFIFAISNTAAECLRWRVLERIMDCLYVTSEENPPQFWRA